MIANYRLIITSLPNSITPALIHVALVALVALEFLDVRVGLIDRFAALCLHDFAQRGIDILGHSARVTANKKLRTLGIDPFPDFRRVLENTVLDVNLMGLIARPRTIEPRENAFALESIEVFLVGIIAFLPLRSEEEPVFSFCTESHSFLQIGAKRGDAGARSDHDDRSVGIFRQMKMLCRAGINRHGNLVRAFSQK